jgi:hypothetical protein
MMVMVIFLFSQQSAYRDHTWPIAELCEKVGMTLDVENPEKSQGLTTEEAQKYAPSAAP